MIIWIVGLSGSGKTTIGREVYKLWKLNASNTVMVDGDEIRKIFKHENRKSDYTEKARRINAERIVEICSWLDSQGINVVCCILCIFQDIMDANRKRFSDYFEVYVQAEMSALKKRDIKNLYSPALKGEISNVIGVDMPFLPPQRSDMIVDNSEYREDFSDLAKEILNTAIVGAML